MDGGERIQDCELVIETCSELVFKGVNLNNFSLVSPLFRSLKRYLRGDPISVPFVRYMVALPSWSTEATGVSEHVPVPWKAENIIIA